MAFGMMNEEDDIPGWDDEVPPVEDEIIVTGVRVADPWVTQVRPGTLAYDQLTEMFDQAFDAAINNALNAAVNNTSVLFENDSATLTASFDTDGDGDTDVTGSFTTETDSDDTSGEVTVNISKGTTVGVSFESNGGDVVSVVDAWVMIDF